MKNEENKRYKFTSNDIIGRGTFGNVYKSIDPKTNKTSRIGHEGTKDGKKVRVTKKSNEKMD